MASQRGDLAGVRQILCEIDGPDVRDAQWCAVVIVLGEATLVAAAEKGHLDMVKELLKYCSKESIASKNRNFCWHLHMECNRGTQELPPYRSAEPGPDGQLMNFLLCDSCKYV
ncbi:hypothetical protein SAY86_014727 [Trapa natans]|uniref:Uncharacterized protein n=1 Tax=Trapa natans TaxID=22666 RepID=A0AAN7KH12_TRANT|nr:hypothetical protein SAY86_014727 [Trapa natans]